MLCNVWWVNLSMYNIYFHESMFEQWCVVYDDNAHFPRWPPSVLWSKLSHMDLMDLSRWLLLSSHQSETPSDPDPLPNPCQADGNSKQLSDKMEISSLGIAFLHFPHPVLGIMLLPKHNGGTVSEAAVHVCPGKKLGNQWCILCHHLLSAGTVI